jgi:hypothetical protein
MTSDSDSDHEMEKNRSFDFQQGTLDDWMASYEKFNNDSKRNNRSPISRSKDATVDDWLGVTRTKPQNNSKKVNAITAKDALVNDWLNEHSNKSVISKSGKSVHSGPGGASFARKEVVTTLAQKKQLDALKDPTPLPSTAAMTVDKKSSLTSKHLDDWLYASEGPVATTKAKDSGKPTSQQLQPTRSIIDDWIYTNARTRTIEPTKKVEKLAQPNVDDWLNITANTNTNNTTINNSTSNDIKTSGTKDKSNKRGSFYFDE